MESYELTVVLSERATPAKKKSVSSTVEKMVKTFKGELKKTDDWGKIDLAYPIAKNNSGNFLHYEIELEKSFAKDFSQKIKLEEGVIRYLFVKGK